MTTDDLPIQMVKITGTPGNGFWSQIHTFTSDEPEKAVLKGTLLASVMVRTDKQGVEVVSYGRDILGRLHEEYFGNFEGTAFECLKKAVERVSIESPESQLAIAVILGNKIILAISPGATVWLKRDNNFGLLLESDSKVELLSGELIENDTYLLSSSIFNQAIPVGTLKIALNTNLEQAGEIIRPMVLGHEKSGGAVGLFFKYTKIVVPEKPFEFTKATIQAEEPVIVSPVTNTTSGRPAREIYLQSARLRRMVKKFIPVIGVLFTVLLVIFGTSKIVGGVSQSRREAKGKTLIAILQTKVDAGVKLMESDPTGINELVLELDNDFKAIDQLKLKETEQYIGIKQKIDKLKDEANQTGFIKEPVVYMDLGLVEEGIEGSRMAITGKNLLILSKDEKGLVIFDIVKKAYQKYDLKSEYFLMATGNNKIYLLGKTEIVEVNLSNGKTNVVVNNGSWEEAKGLAVYLGNLYLLDIQKPSIWRFPAIEGGFGVGKNWLKEEVEVRESGDLAVDGFVWLLDKDKIRKLNLGKEESFTVSDSKFSLTDAGFINTNSDSNELLVLDKNNGRLYRIGKDGKFIKSYQSPVFKNTVSLAASDKKAYLLDGKKIYEIALEQLSPTSPRLRGIYDNYLD